VQLQKEVRFIRSAKELGEGEGGKNEDDEYFDLLPNIYRSHVWLQTSALFVSRSLAKVDVLFESTSTIRQSFGAIAMRFR
jgi:hypothetical protein